ncbi:MAG: hypothetical protein ABSD67_25245 [Terracidiphilus sp.]|jgi:D-sedoheptulose 7-phosphate isomerase
MSSNPDPATVFGRCIAEHLEVVRQVQDRLLVQEAIALAMKTSLCVGGKMILLFGNGGSAADSRHLAGHILSTGLRWTGSIPTPQSTTLP